MLISERTIDDVTIVDVAGRLTMNEGHGLVKGAVDRLISRGSTHVSSISRPEVHRQRVPGRADPVARGALPQGRAPQAGQDAGSPARAAAARRAGGRLRFVQHGGRAARSFSAHNTDHR